MNTSVRRPIVRYQGGRWKLADWIVGHLSRDGNGATSITLPRRTSWKGGT